MMKLSMKSASSNYQQQQQYLQQPQQQMQQQMQQQIPKGILKKPPKRFGVQMQNKNVKNSLIVVVIFILLIQPLNGGIIVAYGYVKLVLHPLSYKTPLLVLL